MCFSAASSFISSSILGVAGIILVSKFKKTNKVCLSLIPLFFAIQQFFEGVVWLNMPYSTFSNTAIFAKNIFLFFAYVFWPFWVPLSFYFAEAEAYRKNILAIIFLIGILVAINALFYAFNSYPTHHLFSIDYNVYILILDSSYLYTLSYSVVCILPMFISSMKFTKSFGVLIFILAIITYAYDKNIGASLWCFFSALASLMLVFILLKDSKKVV
jgi:hypothetical protein